MPLTDLILFILLSLAGFAFMDFLGDALPDRFTNAVAWVFACVMLLVLVLIIFGLGLFAVLSVAAQFGHTYVLAPDWPMRVGFGLLVMSIIHGVTWLVTWSRTPRA